MGAGSGDASHAHAREIQLDVGPERLVRALQEEVLLEAVATAALGHELSLEVHGLERHRNPAPGIEVLERNRGHVRAMQLG